MTSIVVSKRDGILTAPDGTKYRVARGKTLANAAHPAVEANPRDWQPIEITLDIEGAEPLTPGGDPADVEVPATHAQVEQFENDVAELEETLAQRDAEFIRLVEGMGALGIRLPDEDGRIPGWAVDLALDAIASNAQPSTPVPPARPRKAARPPVVPPAGTDG